MKRLVISLLRAGDLLMQRPLFTAMKKEQPNLNLHVLIHDEIKWAAPLIPEIDVFQLFPRQQLQQMLGEASYNILSAPRYLNDFLGKLNGEHFDEVVNLTHTHLSAFLMEDIKAVVKRGLVSDGMRFSGLENPWLKLFNDRFSSNVEFPFHYTEILAKAFGIEVLPTSFSKQIIKRVLFQPLTSDKKKNWSLLNYRQVLDLCYKSRPDLKYSILCSASEKTLLSTYFEEEEICDLSLSDLAGEISGQDLIVTGDTSVMHLGANAGAQILELCLGSSDAWRTGPWSEGHTIISSRIECAPCAHSRPCRQLSHLCGDLISPVFVHRLIQDILGGHPVDSTHGSNQVQSTNVDSEVGYYLSGGENEARFTNKLIWLAINGEKVSQRKISDLENLKGSQIELKSTLFDLQSEFEGAIKRLADGNLTVDSIHGLRRKLSALVGTSSYNNEWIWSFKDLGSMPFKTPLHFLSTFQDRLETLKAAIYFRELLFLNYGGKDESRSGEVSSVCSSEA